MALTADEVRDHLIRHLKWDDSLKGSNIKVDYVERTAVLSGTVPSLAAFDTAQRDAQSIPGVDAVENRLVVKYDHRHPNRTDARIKEDITTILSCAIDCSVDLNAGRISVEVQDGIATLSGVTDAFWKVARIEDLASSVEGVLQIKNNISVLPAERPPDNLIEDEISSALGRMEVAGIENIRVKVKDGVVTLSGSVPTWDVYFDVEDTARYTSGVVEVKNRLRME